MAWHHVGGLEWLGFSVKFEIKGKKPTLFLHNELVKPLWSNSLSAGMNCLENEIATLDTYFNVHSVKTENAFVWEDIHFELIRTLHVKQNQLYLPSFGLIIHYKNSKIFFTTDTTFHFELFKMHYETATLILHECELNTIKSGVHSHYTELLTLPPKIKNKIWLYHYQDLQLPDAIADGFLGFVQKGQCFNF